MSWGKPTTLQAGERPVVEEHRDGYGSASIGDADTLSRFELGGKRPHDIYVSIRLRCRVALYYLGVGRMAARIDWEDSMLTGTPGEAGDSITIYVRENGEKQAEP